MHYSRQYIIWYLSCPAGTGKICGAGNNNHCHSGRMDDDMNLFSFLAGPLGIVMQLLYRLIGNYGWTIILFTILVRVVMFPLSLKQQKSMARQQAYQPMIQEIQNKWKNDRNRMNQEMMKFQEENGIKMTAGCAPTIVTFLVMFGIIAVIQAPLGYMLNVPAEEINAGTSIMRQQDNIGTAKLTDFTKQSVLIGEVRANPDIFVQGVDVVFSGEKQVILKDGQLSVVDGEIVVVSGNYEIRDKRLYIVPTAEDVSSAASASASGGGEEVEQANKQPAGFEGELSFRKVAMKPEIVSAITEFDFDFFGINLAQYPKWNFDRYLIMPILSILTMFASQFIIMKTSGSAAQGRGAMLVMTLVMGAMFGFYAFTVPVGFSLYYTASNIIMTVQQLVVRKIHNPEKIKEQVMLEIEERRKAKKSKKKVVIQDEGGNVIDKELSEAEYAKLRLEMARKMDAEKYGSVSLSEEETAAIEKARKQEEEKYSETAKIKPAAKPEEPEFETKAEKRRRENKEKEANASFAEQERATEEQENKQKEDK